MGSVVKEGLLFDSHCHLTDERFTGQIDDVLGRARAAQVTRIVTIGVDVPDSERAAELAGRHDGLWSTAGVHPHAADTADAAAFECIAELAARPEVVAIGETGLDYHYDNSPRDTQREAFRRHIELAARVGLPLVVHSRDADEDISAALRDADSAVTGVLHCFSGARKLLDTVLELGWHVSFAGMITFRKFMGVDLLRAVPVDRLLLETDSPYLAPVPKRGKCNEPGFLAFVAATAAALRDEPEERLRRQVTENARAFYRLED